MKNIHSNYVLLTRAKYEKLSKVYEKSDFVNKTDIVDIVKRFPPMGNKEVYTLAQLKQDLNHSNEFICNNNDQD